VAAALVARLVRAVGRPEHRRSVRVVERGLGRALGRWGWALAVLLWLIPLWSARAGRPPDLLAAWQMPFGEIPWSDGYGYFEGAHQLLANGRFGGFAEQKPMFPALLSAFLWLAHGSLDQALAVMGVILGLATFLAAREIGLRHGLWCALCAFGMLLGLGRGVAPTVVTEPLGMAFGALALAVLISSRASRRPPWCAAGLFLLALALLVLVLGLLFAIPAVMKAKANADLVRAGDVPAMEAAEKAYWPLWAPFAMPFASAVGVIVGGKLKKRK